MPQTNRYEAQFLDALKDIFIGAKVEGDSGYINLMKIKARYFEQGVFPQLMKDIDAACKPFEKTFREEMFDKLYDFFKRYFSESGSIYFRNTALHQNIYERVYTDDRDVMLFWKTHMLYYVKTDRLFNSMDVDVDGTLFFFDVSGLEHKRANEKRELLYTFKGYKGGKVILTVAYSERGRKTKVDDITHALKEKSIALDEDTLERACRIFEKQSEVDYFINKNAKAFLKEQFDLWLFQYVFGGESNFTEARLKQLQAIKDIAYKIINFIAQFEDELVRVWNKPKFVLNSYYVITLDKITDPQLLKKIFAHTGMTTQLQEWRDLGMLDDKTLDDKTFRVSQNPKGLMEKIFEKDLLGAPVHAKYQHLPLDTRHFPDLELDILALFDDLDVALDGWLVHSENYQALNTLLPKFRERVKCVYIDPPFNLGEDADYLYSVNYKDAAWLTILDNRVDLSKAFIDRSAGSIFVRVGHDGNMLVRLLMNNIFGMENYRNEIIVRRAEESKGEFVKQFKGMRAMTVNYDNIYWYSVDPFIRFLKINKPIPEKQSASHWHSFWKAEDRPNLRYNLLGIDLSKETRGQWMWSKDRATKAVENYETFLKEAQKSNESLEEYWLRKGSELEFIKRAGEGLSSVKYWIPPRESVIADNSWLDIRGYANKWGFKTENSEQLLGRIISGLTKPKDLCLDFFLGSGTTIAVAHKSARKWIGVEMGEHFFSVILPRMKMVVWGEQSGVSKDVNWKGGGFFKYYELEQYEDALRRARYADSDMFATTDAYNSYVFLRDLKMLDAVSLDKPNNRVNVDLEKLYNGIDIAETLSCVTGKGIKRITKETVEFQDGTTASLIEPDWSLIKPLVWW